MLLKKYTVLSTFLLISSSILCAGTANQDYTPSITSDTAGAIIMDNGFIKAGVSEDGSFGVGATTTPGFLFDEDGLGNYGVDDYITPGSPFEYFSVEIDSSTWTNNNASYTTPQMPTTISGDSRSVNVVSNVNSQLEVRQTYSLAPGSTTIKVSVEMKNISEGLVTNVKFARGIDPDVDLNAHGTYDTLNHRGYIADEIILDPVDFVYSLGEFTKKALGLYTVSSYEHNTSVRADWTTIPSDILLGLDDGTGDYVIAIAFNLGNFKVNETKSFTYDYIFGEKIGEIDPIEKTKVCSDFNKDGFADVLIQNPDGKHVIWYLDDNGIKKVKNIGAQTLTSKAIGDFNGDGIADIIWKEGDKTYIIWYMDTDGTIKFSRPVGASKSTLKKVGDYTGDSIDDIIFKRENGSHVIWVMGPTGMIRQILLGGSEKEIRP